MKNFNNVVLDYENGLDFLNKAGHCLKRGDVVTVYTGQDNQFDIDINDVAKDSDGKPMVTYCRTDGTGEPVTVLLDLFKPLLSLQKLSINLSN